jgi:hypothetical protein
MSKFDVQVEGAREAAAHVQRIGTRATHQRTTFQREADHASRQITGVPVDTGRLQRGTGKPPEGFADATDHGYVIGTTVPYARFVFRGTSVMPARPPKVPSDVGNRAADAVAHDLRHA